jgi:hypothetical protein
MIYPGQRDSGVFLRRGFILPKGRKEKELENGESKMVCCWCVRGGDFSDGEHGVGRATV